MQLVFLLPWCACRGIRLEKYISVWDEWKWCLSWFSAISYQSRLYSCQTHSSFLFVPSFQNNRSSCIAQLCSSDLCDKVLFAQQAWGEDAKVITKPFLVMSVCILESFTHYQSCLSYWLRSTSTHQMLVVRKLPSMLPDGHWSKLTQKACSRFQSTSVSDTVASSGIVGDCSKQSQWLVYPFLATLGIWCCEFNISDRCSCALIHCALSNCVQVWLLVGWGRCYIYTCVESMLWDEWYYCLLQIWILNSFRSRVCCVSAPEMTPACNKLIVQMLWSASVHSLLETCYADLIQYLDTYWKMCFGYVAKIYSQLLFCVCLGLFCLYPKSYFHLTDGIIAVFGSIWTVLYT